MKKVESAEKSTYLPRDEKSDLASSPSRPNGPRGPGEAFLGRVRADDVDELLPTSSRPASSPHVGHTTGPNLQTPTRVGASTTTSAGGQGSWAHLPPGEIRTVPPNISLTQALMKRVPRGFAALLTAQNYHTNRITAILAQAYLEHARVAAPEGIARIFAKVSQAVEAISYDTVQFVSADELEPILQRSLSLPVEEVQPRIQLAGVLASLHLGESLAREKPWPHIAEQMDVISSAEPKVIQALFELWPLPSRMGIRRGRFMGHLQTDDPIAWVPTRKGLPGFAAEPAYRALLTSVAGGIERLAPIRQLIEEDFSEHWLPDQDPFHHFHEHQDLTRRAAPYIWMATHLMDEGSALEWLKQTTRGRDALETAGVLSGSEVEIEHTLGLISLYLDLSESDKPLFGEMIGPCMKHYYRYPMSIINALRAVPSEEVVSFMALLDKYVLSSMPRLGMRAVNNEVNALIEAPPDAREKRAEAFHKKNHPPTRDKLDTELSSLLQRLFPGDHH